MFHFTIKFFVHKWFQSQIDVQPQDPRLQTTAEGSRT